MYLARKHTFLAIYNGVLNQISKVFQIAKRKIQGNHESGRRGEGVQGGDIHVFVLTKTKIKW